jgi:poly(3-hydroxybutyrate) depolymerase
MALDGVTANKPYTGMAVDNRINDEADRDGFMVIYPLPKPREVGVGIGDKTMRDWNSPGVGALSTDPTYDDVDLC